MDMPFLLSLTSLFANACHESKFLTGLVVAIKIVAAALIPKPITSMKGAITKSIIYFCL